MARGGHAHSGPAHDPKSERSEKRGLSSSAVLSAAGYTGRMPGLNHHLPNPNARHRRLWEELWRYPHATVWINQPWRYALVAELVRLMEMTEHQDCPIGVWTSIRQHREDLGLSSAGARLEGWEIPTGVWTPPAPRTGSDGSKDPVDEVGEKRKQRRSQTLDEE